MISLLIRNLPQGGDKFADCKEFFNLLTFLVEQNKNIFVVDVKEEDLGHEQFLADELLEKCHNEISNRAVIERRADEDIIDYVAAGYFLLA